MSQVGYSGTPLAKKLGLKPGSKLRTIGALHEFLTWLEPAPEIAGDEEAADVVVAFLTERNRLLPTVLATTPLLADRGGPLDCLAQEGFQNPHRHNGRRVEKRNSPSRPCRQQSLRDQRNLVRAQVRSPAPTKTLVSRMWNRLTSPPEPACTDPCAEGSMRGPAPESG